jgi:uncharacterized protein (TIGR03083 family)
VHPVLGQRRRLEAVLRDLADDEWQQPSRCAGWTVQDVVTHLTSTNGFWALSIQAGASGSPTELLATFDPVATPAQLVDRDRGTPVAETLARFTAGNDALAAAIDALDDAGWTALAEAPPGHLPIALVADHALWDSWVHERDILLPLGRASVVDPDEVRHCLRYGAGLGRAFALCRGSTEQGAIELEVTGPDDRVVVVVDGDVVRIHTGPAPDGARVVRGDAVALVEALSIRPVDGAVPDGVAWLTAGLAQAFDQPSAG